ncbi:type IV pilus inner membrane component PilO [Bdellovibrio reynosensis]|uniref:Type 4a pilus biogenesis protein PilO n=1 Tax=Bdellovibrio reynosensis TaxID=2835041 RepID=A0ABY4CD82_9BACT|nr:type 4a pilus biogenesis protein PilO [Bdellovibrio reynosensis]UOF02933.1 type 4a pilus biogenesis protein PilO [Bdellovibrio reynosensis]
MNKFFDQLAAQPFNKVLFIGLVLTGLYWYAVYDDGTAVDEQIATIAQQLQEEENKKKDTDATLKQVQEMQEKVGQLSAKYQEISRRLPSVLFSIDINKAIDDFARNSGVSVKSKKPSENIKKEVVEEVPVEVSLEGSYAELAQFTFLVSTAERMARVKNIVISEPEPNSKRIKFEGQVVGYKLAPEEKKKPEGTETPQ